MVGPPKPADGIEHSLKRILPVGRFENRSSPVRIVLARSAAFEPVPVSSVIVGTGICTEFNKQSIQTPCSVGANRIGASARTRFLESKRL